MSSAPAVTAEERRGAAVDAFDVARVRKDFPILGRKVHDQPLVYLDNAATAQKPRAVIDAVVSRQVSAPDHPSQSQPDPIPCDRASCHATFQIEDDD